MSLKVAEEVTKGLGKVGEKRAKENSQRAFGGFVPISFEFRENLINLIWFNI